MDAFGRTIDYLRISVTERCNERCVYCMPSGYHPAGGRSEQLTREELVRVAEAATGLGFRKFRLTGGEPLLREDLPEIVRDLARLPGVGCLGLSTNGVRLAPVARQLRDDGLRTVNISLDALDPQIYRRITGGEVAPVLAGLRAAVAAGFEQVKLNCVLMRGVNEGQIWPLILFASEHGLPLRLIELMPVTTSTVLTDRNFLPVSEAMALVGQHDELEPQPDRHLGWGPARYYRLRRTGALVGFIGAITDQHFCATCNKMRLTANGRVRPCLGDHGELDLRAALRSANSAAALRAVLAAAMAQKPKEHQFCAQYQPDRPMTAIGG
jgi:cyclic pyranopterin phosphate synthase